MEGKRIKKSRNRVLGLGMFILICAAAGLLFAPLVDRPTIMAATPAAAAEPSPAAQTGSGRAEAPVITLPDFADIAERTNPGVVYIESTEMVESNWPFEQQEGRPMFREPFWDFFFGPDRRSPDSQQDREQVRTGRGSGVIIDTEGYILTNNHMVEGAAEVVVELDDGRKYNAEVVGTDPPTDLALIKIDPEGNIPIVPMGNSDDVRIGEWVMAIGNPHNFKHTVSVGVVSAKGRQLPYLMDREGQARDAALDNFIQTDAAINFGNSGGPLINTRGEIIGINTAISAMAQNIGFAIPINIAKNIMPQLIEKGSVSRGFLGIRVAAVTPEIQEAFKLESGRGAIVHEVNRGMPAEKAGLKHGDVITRVNGNEIDDSSDLVASISSIPPGEMVALDIIRDGERMKIEVELAARSEGMGYEQDARRQDSPEEDKLGLKVQPLNDGLRQRFGLAEEVEGVVVTGVRPLSSAGQADIREGDVITEIFKEQIDSVEKYQQEIEKLQAGDLVLMYVTRGDTSFFKTLKLDTE